MPADEQYDVAKDRNKVNSNTKYGCHNHKPFDTGYFAPDRVYRPDGTFYQILARIPFTMSRQCKFDLRRKDPACRGCKHIEDGC